MNVAMASTNVARATFTQKFELQLKMNNFHIVFQPHVVSTPYQQFSTLMIT